MTLRREAEKRKSSPLGTEMASLCKVSLKMVAPPIMKLDIDCFHEVFDYLCLDDIISIGHTCQRLQRIASRFIQQNFAAKRKTYVNDNIYMCWKPRQISIFSLFIEKISIFGDFPDSFLSINAVRFHLLNEIRLAQIELDSVKIECIKAILPQVEVIELDQCCFKQNFYGDFLKLCPKLHRLSVSRSSYDRDGGTIIGTDNEWMRQKYASLEHLELTDLYEFKGNELKHFFESNQNVHSFSTDAKSLLINRQSFLSCGGKIQRLAIDFHPKNIDSDAEPAFIVNLIYQLLTELYEKGFYRSLHLYITFFDRNNCLQKLFSMDSLEMIGGFVTLIENPLLNVKNLDINKGLDVTNLEEFPDKFPKLERIHFTEATANDILPFVRQSKSLKVMKIDLLVDGTHLEKGVLDLVALDKERSTLIRARKLMIYVNETVFLATKWATSDLNLKFIELRRGESFEFKHLNARHRFITSF
ncbi:uncharacterized protein LOC116347461 [Contarinia nasturtii]|uniref:uncharacterized protein LOC116347461 n=1 Tax=Contarinia nasturtii TaxID=265458 RepID=UPI0012D4637F|nr:uncharacterized protein LOC116347461 [Contarinia nasturtii]